MPSPTALLVIDVQRALTAGEWAAHDAQGLIARINGLITKARAARAPVIFVQHEDTEGPMTQGSPGWQLADGLLARPGDHHIRKSVCDSFHGTGLQALLQKLGVRELVVCGLQSEFCVDSTTRGALAQGFPVTLVNDGHSTLDNGVLKAEQITRHHTATLGNLTSYGVRVTPVAASDVKFEPGSAS